MPVFFFALFLLACNSKKAETVQEQAPHQENILELPISARYRDKPAPNGASITLDQHDDTSSVGSQLLDLRQGETLHVKIHPLVPYGHVLRVLSVAELKNVHDIYFRVRCRDNPPEAGWLGITDVRVLDHDKHKVDLEADHPIPWREFTSRWDAFHALCMSESQDCAVMPEKPSEDGLLQIELSISNQGVRLTFQQIDPPPEVERQRVQVMDFNENEGSGFRNMITKKTVREIGIEAWFTFRYRSAVQEQSAASEMLTQICEGKRCVVRVRAENTFPAGRVINVLGSLFESETMSPIYVFDRDPNVAR